MLPSAILFDMDGTILNYEVKPEEAWKEACRIPAERTGLFETEHLLSAIDEIREWYWSDPERSRAGRLNLHNARIVIVRAALERLGCNDERVVNEIATMYSSLRDGSSAVSPDAKETLREIGNRGIKLALLTNGAADMQRAKIRRFGLAKYFGVCLIEGELGCGKPDPKIYETALDELQVRTETAWMVGDDLLYDIDGAQRVGLFSIWCDYDKKGLPENSKIKPDRIINNISEVLSLM
jgi:putative hydrolase of the HAD superfamily